MLNTEMAKKWNPTLTLLGPSDTYICVNKLTINVSGYGLSPGGAK